MESQAERLSLGKHSWGRTQPGSYGSSVVLWGGVVEFLSIWMPPVQFPETPFNAVIVIVRTGLFLASGTRCFRHNPSGLSA